MVGLKEIEAIYNSEDYFEIIELPEQIGKLRKILGCQNEEDISKEDRSFNSASERILSLLQKNNCRFVLLEKQYLDDDSLASYSAYYSKSARDYKKRNNRLHFFKNKISFKNLHGLELDEKNNLKINNKLFEDLNGDNYLGFTVVRSLNPPTLGRTFVKPFLTTTEFILCDIETNATLTGMPLKVQAAPFMQQDENVSCCATISLWIASESMHQRFNNIHYSTYNITELANRYRLTQGRALPSQGLSVEQMDWALLGMGYDPISFEMGYGDDVESAGIAKSVIYTYLESNIPVILGIKNNDGGHVITAVGHGFEVNNKPKKLYKDQAFFCASEWVPYFIIQDDKEGPYMYLKFEDKPRTPILNEFPVLISDSPNFESNCSEEAKVKSIIIPHPVENTYSDGRNVSLKLGLIIKSVNDAFEQNGQHLDFLENIVLRTFLISSKEFKQSLLKKEREGMSKDLIALYRKKIMPKYIWVSEISTIDYRNQLIDNNAHEILGEIILDPTSTYQECDFLSIHLPGYFFEMFPSDQDPKVAFTDKNHCISLNKRDSYLSFVRH